MGRHDVVVAHFLKVGTVGDSSDRGREVVSFYIGALDEGVTVNTRAAIRHSNLGLAVNA